MPKLKNNTLSRLFFYIIAFIGGILLVNAIYVKHKEIVDDTQNTQRYLTKIYQERLNSLFTKHETIQSLIADEYANNSNLDSTKLDLLRKLNPLLLNIRIFSADGELLHATLSGATSPNLLRSENTRQWFQEALNAGHMVVGRPYLLKSIDKWILPIRKSIVDNNGNTVAVISTSLDFNKLQAQWSQENNYNHTIRVILNNGAFPIVNSKIKVQDAPEYYNKAYNPPYYSYSTSYGLVKAPADKQNNEQSAVLANRDFFIEGVDSQSMQAMRTNNIAKHISSQMLYTLDLNTHYHFLVSAEIPYRQLLAKLFKESFFYCVFYLLLMIIVFILLCWIDKIEKSKIAELTYKAEHDALTGLANHSVINKHFARMQKEKETPFALFYLKIDNFSNINKAH